MSTANCYWTKTKCISSKNAPEIEEWWNTFDNCNDLSSLSIINKYCGDFTKLEDTYTLSLSRVNGRYGDSNLFCSYLYKAGKNNDQLTVKIPNNIDLIVANPRSGFIPAIIISVILKLLFRTRKSE